MGQGMGQDTMLGIIDLGAAFLKAWVRRLGLEGVVHPHMCFQRLCIWQQTRATFHRALFLLVETLVLVGDTLAVKLLVALFVGTSESIVRT